MISASYRHVRFSFLMVIGFIFGAAVIFHILKSLTEKVITMATNRQSETQSDCSTLSHKRLNVVPKTTDLSKMLESFHHLPTPHHVHPTCLAKHGFRYSRSKGATVCTGCCKVVDKWEVGDQPEAERFHKCGCRYMTRSNEDYVSHENREINESEDMEVAETTSAVQNVEGLKFLSLQVANMPNADTQTVSMPVIPLSSEAPVAAAGSSSTSSERLIDRLTPLSVLRQRRNDASPSSTPLPDFNGSPPADRTVTHPVRPLPRSYTSPSRDMQAQGAIPKTDIGDTDRSLGMNRAANRLATFERYWSAENVFKNIRLLVICGFFCLGQGDAIQCFCCEQILANWKRDDDPRRRHLECSPDCRFAIGESCGNIPLPRESRRRRADIQRNPPQASRRHESQTNTFRSLASWREANSGSSLEQASESNLPAEEVLEADLPAAYANLTPAQIQRGHLLIQFPCTDPANPAMREEHARLQTFTNPHFRASTNVTASNECLAQAGLYYVGLGDQTKCWFCDGGLKDYQPGDDPWVEHAKFFPECEYLLQQRGPSWIINISIQYPNIVRPALPRRANQVLPATVSSPSVALSALGQASHEPWTTEGALTVAMQTALVQQVRTIGFTDQLIRYVQTRRISRFGNGYQDIHTFLEALLHPNVDPGVLEGAEPPRGPRNVIDMSGRTITIQGGNFIGPSIVGGRLIRRSRGPNDVLINGVPWEDYLAQENDLENDGEGLHVFDNFEEVVSTGSSTIDDAPVSSEDTPSSSTVLHGTSEEQLQALQREHQCKICYSSPVQVLLQPCGHVCTCMACSRRLNSCPVCRRRITNRVRAYYA